MNSRQLFGVVVRAFGLYFLLLGISAVHSIVQTFGIRTLGYFEWRPAAAIAALYFVIGFVLLRKSEPIVTFAYPDETQVAKAD